ncbi:MAG: DNA-3-methyladenine glycosylase 2 family protein [Gammaproteobacteria bacterium]|nr:DNA-3-methyladenine glycosylase 2 family protein [Gammaproteobacteria bacterium]NNC96777.1 DNA-3-methyladenine glycosylase 2 family protein [Gammaproteobacteria bacterium]NNM14966.1 DNA-3-methyladenine glycosylase 2 family protein [Gammaproteobacteria bacterium]
MSQKAHAHFLEQSRKHHKRLHKVFKTYGPMRLYKRKQIDLASLLCRSIAGQQLSVKAAATIWGRFADKTGSTPLMTYLDNAREQDLRSCGLSRAKTKAMFAVAEAHRSGILDEQKLRLMSHPQRSLQLTSIWGVGQWTANMLNIFYFGEKDIWPDKDVAVRNNFLKLIGDNKNSILESEKFAPYRTYLALYMWRVANARPD